MRRKKIRKCFAFCIIFYFQSWRRSRKKKVDWTILYLKNEHSSVCVWAFGLPKNKSQWNHNHHLVDFTSSRFRLNLKQMPGSQTRVMHWRVSMEITMAFVQFVFFFFEYFKSILFDKYFYKYSFLASQILFIFLVSSTCCHALIEYRINLFDRLSPNKIYS